MTPGALNLATCFVGIAAVGAKAEPYRTLSEPPALLGEYLHVSRYCFPPVPRQIDTIEARQTYNLANTDPHLFPLLHFFRLFSTLYQEIVVKQ